MAALFRGIVYHYQTEMHSMGRKTIAQRSATITRLETTRGANCSNLSFFFCVMGKISRLMRIFGFRISALTSWWWIWVILLYNCLVQKTFGHIVPSD